MELQLGLALPYNPVHDFDLNSNHVFDPNLMMSSAGCCFEINKKRSFNEDFDNTSSKRTLPLLSWNDQPNDEDDDDPHTLGNCSPYPINQDDEEGNNLVGWPPINSNRMNLLYYNHQHQGNYIVYDRTEENASNSMYVKVKMVGVAVGRKIDLGLHHSYQTLETTLIEMFGKYLKNGMGPIFTYQDREGDWLIVGDVPWENFIESVQRIEIRRECH